MVTELPPVCQSRVPGQPARDRIDVHKT